jgi:hypothetical protein
MQEQPSEAFIYEGMLYVPEIFFFGFSGVSTHPNPWAQEIARLLLPIPDFSLLLPEDSQACYIAREWFFHLCVLDWLIKCKWDSKRKPIFKKKSTIWRPVGEFWRSVVDLCMQCHGRETGYPDAATWFSAIYQERELAGKSANLGKDLDLKLFRQESGQLQVYENPFTQPATRLLIKIATEKAESSDLFRKDYYRPFLSARSALGKTYAMPEFVSIREIAGEFFSTASSLRRKGNKSYERVST